jgi:hypothetical protein
MSTPYSPPSEQIEQLETRIDELRDSIQRSRRLVTAGRACVGVGLALLLGLLVGLLGFTPARMVAAIVLAVGGFVLSGSSRSSTDELERTLKRTEQERSAAIDALDLVEAQDLAGERDA